MNEEDWKRKEKRDVKEFFCYYLQRSARTVRRMVKEASLRETNSFRWRWCDALYKRFEFEWKWGRESRWMSSKICFWLRQTMLSSSHAIKYIAHKINDSGASGKCVIVVPSARVLINLPEERRSCENKTQKKNFHTVRAFLYFPIIFQRASMNEKHHHVKKASRQTQICL